VRSIYGYSVRRMLGIGGRGWALALPLTALLIAFVPAIVAVGVPALLDRFVLTADSPIALERVQALADDPSFVPAYPQYLFVISAVILLASAFCGSSSLCGDRDSGLRTLYRRAAVSRTAYLGAKLAAVTTALLVVTGGPLLLLFLGRALNGAAVTGGDPVRIAVASLAVSIPYAAVSLAAAAVWRRRTTAAAVVVIAMAGLSALSSFLRDVTASSGWEALDVGAAPLELAAQILGEAAGSGLGAGLLVAVVSVTTAVRTR
jgi:ABC-2 type transport system permease protein